MTRSSEWKPKCCPNYPAVETLGPWYKQQTWGLPRGIGDNSEEWLWIIIRTSAVSQSSDMWTLCYRVLHPRFTFFAAKMSIEDVIKPINGWIWIDVRLQKIQFVNNHVMYLSKFLSQNHQSICRQHCPYFLPFKLHLQWGSKIERFSKTVKISPLTMKLVMVYFFSNCLPAQTRKLNWGWFFLTG